MIIFKPIINGREPGADFAVSNDPGKQDAASNDQPLEKPPATLLPMLQEDPQTPAICDSFAAVRARRASVLLCGEEARARGTAASKSKMKARACSGARYCCHRDIYGDAALAALIAAIALIRKMAV